jgi:hypothetical protein
MNPRSSPLKLTPEDRLIRRWKILGLIVTATPRHEPDSVPTSLHESRVYSQKKF